MRIGLRAGVALQQAGADHHRRQVRLGRERAAQRFHQREVRGHAEAQAAVRFGQRRAQQVELARQALPERRRRIVKIVASACRRCSKPWWSSR
jgi:hypothetical protein